MTHVLIIYCFWGYFQWLWECGFPLELLGQSIYFIKKHACHVLKDQHHTWNSVEFSHPLALIYGSQLTASGSLVGLTVVFWESKQGMSLFCLKLASSLTYQARADSSVSQMTDSPYLQVWQECCKSWFVFMRSFSLLVGTRSAAQPHRPVCCLGSGPSLAAAWTAGTIGILPLDAFHCL